MRTIRPPSKVKATDDRAYQPIGSQMSPGEITTVPLAVPSAGDEPIIPGATRQPCRGQWPDRRASTGGRL